MKSAWELLGIKNYNLNLKDFARLRPDLFSEAAAFFSPWMSERLKSESMYEQYVEDQRDEIEEVRRDEQLILPLDLDYLSPKLSLSTEEKEKLVFARPSTIG